MLLFSMATALMKPVSPKKTTTTTTNRTIRYVAPNASFLCISYGGLINYFTSWQRATNTIAENADQAQLLTKPNGVFDRHQPNAEDQWKP